MSSSKNRPAKCCGKLSLTGIQRVLPLLRLGMTPVRRARRSSSKGAGVALIEAAKPTKSWAKATLRAGSIESLVSIQNKIGVKSAVRESFGLLKEEISQFSWTKWYVVGDQNFPSKTLSESTQKTLSAKKGLSGAPRRHRQLTLCATGMTLSSSVQSQTSSSCPSISHWMRTSGQQVEISKASN